MAGKIALFTLTILAATALYPAGGINLMPKPGKMTVHDSKFRVNKAFAILTFADTPRITHTVQHFRTRLAGRTGLFFDNPKLLLREKNTTNDTLVISCTRPGKLKLREDESYTLGINGSTIELSAPTDIGVIRGIETLLQLLAVDEKGYYFPGVSIEDSPRFPWRGLMIDSCRHFFPVEVIKRNLDAMAAVKLNVLHWHLSEDQGFRVECRAFPKLHRLGSDGLYYTHEQIRDVIEYASIRGIRVMPEFDIPGHSTSWLRAYPEYGSGPQPPDIERGYGIMDPTFNPAMKKTYKFFDKFFKEMAQLFPDDYMHIGGDENNGKEWDANPKVQAYKKKHHLKDNHQLQAHFNKKILKILTKYKKKMVGWDEIFQPELPPTILIHSWRGKDAMKEAARKGYNSILSNGYYIDLCRTTEFHYLNDPVPADTDLTAEEQKRILGGEATMWAELVTPETVDSRIWPRTAAIAERFWSPGKTRDVEDMYRRLSIISRQLEELGLTHIKNRDMMLRRLTNGQDVTALRTLVETMEPLKKYARHNQGVKYTFFTPYTRVVDVAQPDAEVARLFRRQVSHFLENISAQSAQPLKVALETWKNNHAKLKPVIQGSPILKEIEPVSEYLSQVAAIGFETLDSILENRALGAERLDSARKTLELAAKPQGHAELMIIPAIRQLLDKAAGL